MKKTMNFRPVIRENYAWWLQKTQHFTRAELEEDFIEPEPFGVSVTLHYKDTPVMEMSVHSYPGKEKDETGHIDIKIKSWSCYTGDIKQIYEKNNTGCGNQDLKCGNSRYRQQIFFEKDRTENDQGICADICKFVSDRTSRIPGQNGDCHGSCC